MNNAENDGGEINETGNKSAPKDNVSKLEGRVFWGNTTERVPDAIVKFKPLTEGLNSKSELTDEDGDFEVQLESGEWEVIILCQNGYQPKPDRLKVPEDVPTEGKKEFKSLRSMTRDIDQEFGKRFFGGLIAGFLVLASVWIVLHVQFPQQVAFEVASSLLTLTAEAWTAIEETKEPTESERLREIVAAMKGAINPESARGDLKKKLGEAEETVGKMEGLLEDTVKKVIEELNELKAVLSSINDDQEVKAFKGKIDKARSEVTELKKPSNSETLKKLIKSEANEKLKNNKDVEAKFDILKGLLARDSEKSKENLKKELENLMASIPSLAHEEFFATEGTKVSLLWSTGDKRYLEILFWAFAGILVRLIFRIAIYLRWNRFFRAGVSQHIGLLVVAPILTLVFVFLISMIKLTGDNLTVDLSDPRIMAGISFIVAATPWRLWERLQGVGGKILSDDAN